MILVRIETSPEDIHGMHAAEGILTARGGMTSHAAVVARGMGKPCVAGCRRRCTIDYARAARSRVGGRDASREGDVITIDGSTGEVMLGPGADGRAAALGRLRHADGLGRRAPHG